MKAGGRRGDFTLEPRTAFNSRAKGGSRPLPALKGHRRLPGPCRCRCPRSGWKCSHMDTFPNPITETDPTALALVPYPLAVPASCGRRCPTRAGPLAAQAPGQEGFRVRLPQVTEAERTFCASYNLKRMVIGYSLRDAPAAPGHAHKPRACHAHLRRPYPGSLLAPGLFPRP
jgi:hypothetical protein